MAPIGGPVGVEGGQAPMPPLPRPMAKIVEVFPVGLF